ncbi:hypothetical protein Y695_01334 [Hydrogenophaga sp. T4]|nr:hypothetical protein Y695_01334 [Hydrogenophaga sp. T4]
MRLRHAGLEEHEVHQFEVRAGSLARVAQNLVDHLVVARVAQGLGKGPVDEGRAQHQRMNRGLCEDAVSRLQLGRHLGGFSLESHEVFAHRAHERPGDLVKNLIAHATMHIPRQSGRDVGLVQPARDFGKVGAQIVDHHLVGLADAGARLPLFDKPAHRLGNTACAVTDAPQIVPLVDQATDTTAISPVLSRLTTTALPL